MGVESSLKLGGNINWNDWKGWEVMDARGWMIGIALVCTMFSVLISLHLIYKHLRHYTVPTQQIYIIRILLMVT